MSEQPPKPPSDGAAPPSRPPEDVAALVRTIQKDVAEKAQLPPGSSMRRKTGPAWYVLLVLAAVANGYLWIGRPAWIVGESAGIQTPEQEEGVLRFRMYIQGQRIEAYRQQHGELPTTLAETGPPLPGMRYQVTGPDSWELLGEAGQSRLILHSSQPMGEFLGNYQGTLGIDGQ